MNQIPPPSGRENSPDADPAADAGQRWRSVAAALADDRRLRLYARIVTAAERGTPLDAQALDGRERRSLAVLQKAGLVSTGACEVRPQPGAFARLLSGGGGSADTSVRRFLVDGKVRSYPRRQADRLELLNYLAGQVFEQVSAPPGVRPVLEEREVTRRLAAFSEDPAAIRRYLVDEGIVARNPEGSRYWLIHPRPADGWEFAGG